ncbi:MAG: putative RDD family membrane protein YckC [Planctomycetota bacterium]|jgi:uncharacterized RDD family membrane protein YckC
MPSLKMRTPEGVTLEVELAGAGSRFGAGILDLYLIGMFAVVVALGLTALSRFDPTGMTDFMMGFLAFGSLLVVVLYMVLCPLWMKGQTPGKRAFGLRVVADGGGEAQPVALILRGMLWMADMMPLPVPLGLIVMSGSEKRQRLGDLVGGTLVVRVADPSRRPRPWNGQAWSDLPGRRLLLTPSHARRLSESDLSLLFEIVTRRGLTDAARKGVYARAARHYRGRLDLDVGLSDGAFLKEVFLFTREFLLRGSSKPKSESGGEPATNELT